MAYSIPDNVHSIPETRVALQSLMSEVINGDGGLDERVSALEGGVGSSPVYTDGSGAAGEYARFLDSTNIEGRTVAQVRADLDLEIGTDIPALAHTHVAADVTDFAAAVLALASALGHTHVAANITDFSAAVIALLIDANLPDNLTITNITQITNRSHTNLSDIGSNTHAQIDTHIAAANPHSGSQPLDATLTSLAAVAGVQGDLLYASGSDAWTRLAKDANATRYLSNQGTSNNPSWNQVNLANGVTGSLPSGNLATSLKTVSKILYIENPAATDVIPICYLGDAGTVIAIRSVTDAGTVTFNIEQRGKFTPATTGTNCLSASQVADTNGEEVTSSFNDATVPADNWLVFVASAVTSSPTKLWVSVEYTID